MNDLTITIKGIFENQRSEHAEIDLSQYTETDELKDQFTDGFTDDEGETLEVEADQIKIEVESWNEIPKEYQDLKTVWEYIEAVEKHDKDIVDAAIYCGVELDDIDEAYQGEYKDDEDFAKEMADQMGCWNQNAGWPHNCIDWEYAAKELMYDYSDHKGYYFRNL